MKFPTILSSFDCCLCLSFAIHNHSEYQSNLTVGTSKQPFPPLSSSCVGTSNFRNSSCHFIDKDIGFLRSCVYAACPNTWCLVFRRATPRSKIFKSRCSVIKIIRRNSLPLLFTSHFLITECTTTLSSATAAVIESRLYDPLITCCNNSVQLLYYMLWKRQEKLPKFSG